MVKIFYEGAKLYVCGSSIVGEGVASMTSRIYQDAGDKEGKEVSNDTAQLWFENIKGERFASDVFT